MSSQSYIYTNETSLMRALSLGVLHPGIVTWYVTPWDCHLVCYTLGLSLGMLHPGIVTWCVTPWDCHLVCYTLGLSLGMLHPFIAKVVIARFGVQLNLQFSRSFKMYIFK